MTPRASVGHYRLSSKIGAGGMGEVWRATDTRLNREVAIKFLPDTFADDPERMARFQREAQVLAALNHPNIAQIYGAEDRALIMELVEGEMLKGPLDVETSLSYARQVALALEAAHDKGIVHRDLKPANVMITSGGVVKVLDFGLARISQDGGASNASISPTLTISPSHTGVILGTAAYMSPEQARGKPVDKRADIWAFGCLLYEVLTGKPAFAGDTISDILAAVLKEEPDLSVIPGQLRSTIAKCLRKDPAQRWRDIGDVRMSLEEQPAVAEVATARKAQQPLLPWVLMAVMAVAAATLGVLYWRAPKPDSPLFLKLDVDLGPDAVAGRDTTVALSRDGTRMVFPVRIRQGKQALALRFLNEMTSRVLAGTDEAINPFFSPDGEWVGFFADSKLKKVSIHGGTPVTLCAARSGRGGAWTADGSIIAALGVTSGLSRISDQGGTPEPLTQVSATETHRWPQILPGGQAVLFTGSPIRTNFTHAGIEAVNLKTGARKLLLRDAFFGRYVPSGQLLFMRQETLFSAPMDLGRLEVKGTAVPVSEDIASSIFGGAQYAVADNGTLVYLPGKLSGAGWQVLWTGADGKSTPLNAKQDAYFEPHFSPDGKRLAYAAARGKSDIWVFDLDRKTEARLTFNEANLHPVWTPDGKYIVYLAGSMDPSAPGQKLMRIRSDGGGEPVLLDDKAQGMPLCFSIDGKRLLMSNGRGKPTHVWTVPIEGGDSERARAGKSEPLFDIPGTMENLAISPDGHWIAYASDEAGRIEVFVRRFNGATLGEGKWQVSSAGGIFPVWSRAGQTIVYQRSGGATPESQDFHMMAVDYQVQGDVFRPGTPRLWSSEPIPAYTAGAMAFDLAADGRHLVVMGNLPEAESSRRSLHVVFVVNFLDELRRRFPQR